MSLTILAAMYYLHALVQMKNRRNYNSLYLLQTLSNGGAINMFLIFLCRKPPIFKRIAPQLS